MFEHSFFNNFCNNSLILLLHFYSLSFFFSLLLLSNKKRGKMLSLKVVGNWLSKNHAPKIIPLKLICD